jgi:hypothetical protein
MNGTVEKMGDTGASDIEDDVDGRLHSQESESVIIFRRTKPGTLFETSSIDGDVGCDVDAKGRE